MIAPEALGNAKSGAALRSPGFFTVVPHTAAVKRRTRPKYLMFDKKDPE
jgi:hypothetical protein